MDRIALLTGGISAEREVALASARNVRKALAERLQDAALTPRALGELLQQWIHEAVS